MCLFWCFRILRDLSATCWHCHVATPAGVSRIHPCGYTEISCRMLDPLLSVLARSSHRLILDYANGLSLMLMVSALNKTLGADLNVRVSWKHCDGEGLDLYDLSMPTKDNTLWFMVMCACITLLIEIVLTFSHSEALRGLYHNSAVCSNVCSSSIWTIWIILMHFIFVY